MMTMAPNEIESQFAQLSTEAQLSLLERLVHQTRINATPGQQEWEAGLSAMAADPEMQRELRSINAEFYHTETDRLGTD